MLVISASVNDRQKDSFEEDPNDFGTNRRTILKGVDPSIVLPVTTSARSSVNLVTHDHSVPVTTLAYTELISSTSDIINHLQIFDSSGQMLVLAVGPAASEVDKLYIFPGGNGGVDLTIPAGSRVSVKAVSANTSGGYLAITGIK